MTRRTTERDGYRCDGDADRPHVCEARASQRPQPRAANPLDDLARRVSALETENATLKAQVASLQMAAPKGIGHAGLAKVGT